MQKHDKAGKYGFDVDPELLAHDLAMFVLSKSTIDVANTHLMYDTYTKTYHDIKAVIDDKTKYDDTYR